VTERIIFAIPKGRILDEALPLMQAAGIEPEPAFFDESSRALLFATNNPAISIIRVRAFDVATFVAHGAAHIGIVGSDVIDEFDYSELYAPVDLGIGRCRISVAMPQGAVDDVQAGHIRVATKYPATTARYYHARGIQAECVKLNGDGVGAIAWPFGTYCRSRVVGQNARRKWFGRNGDHLAGFGAADRQSRCF
jgi:ATP phosphoribosyltransferase